jgi:hypothetical protein
MKKDDTVARSSAAETDTARSVINVNDRKTMSVPQAGRLYYDLGKNASYDAAKRGEIPVIKIGRRLRVPIVALERRLELAAAQVEGSAQEGAFQGRACLPRPAASRRHDRSQDRPGAPRHRRVVIMPLPDA